MLAQIDTDSVADVDLGNKSEQDERYECEQILKETWKSLGPSFGDDNIIGN